jgi:catechol 2,3-dioxygenase-like lactoylglutathione lyase family enzyme
MIDAPALQCGFATQAVNHPKELLMKIDRIHHVAYRCKDAKETVEWYKKMLNMDFVLAIAENQVPSTKEPDPYMHIFLDAGGGNILAFFEIPSKPPMGRDPNTPDWVQHIAFKVKDKDELLAYGNHLKANGLNVVGVTDHAAFYSIYFYDPNGHRVELACPAPEEAEMFKRADAVKWEMLEEWSRTKRAPRQAAFLHEKEFAEVK